MTPKIPRQVNIRLLAKFATRSMAASINVTLGARAQEVTIVSALAAAKIMASTNNLNMKHVKISNIDAALDAAIPEFQKGFNPIIDKDIAREMILRNTHIVINGHCFFMIFGSAGAGLRKATLLPIGDNRTRNIGKGEACFDSILAPECVRRFWQGQLIGRSIQRVLDDHYDGALIVPDEIRKALQSFRPVALWDKILI